MPALIQKCGYIKGGAKAGGYMKYISTREGVEVLEGSGDPTEKQRELIEKILQDFPDSRELFEYSKYRDCPCVHTASAFISTALDYNAESLQPDEIYMRYIATRPGAEKQGEHGLFGDEEVKEVFPAVEELQKRGYKVVGPIGADSVFSQALHGKYNSVLSLYHDQGHIATKTLDFERTISITAGMPILRTSVDHGTAFDIAGKGIASAVSMKEAVRLAVKYAPAFLQS